jgi:hypothetical protein
MDSNNENVTFTSNIAKGTQINGTTDIDGKYHLVIPTEAYNVQYSFIGYESIQKFLLQ